MQWFKVDESGYTITYAAPLPKGCLIRTTMLIRLENQLGQLHSCEPSESTVYVPDLKIEDVSDLIDIDIPDGWELVAIREAEPGEFRLDGTDEPVEHGTLAKKLGPRVIVRKTTTN